MKVFADHAQMVEEKAAHVGMSIRASGIAEAGKTRDGVPVDLSSATITSITATTYRIGNLGGAAATTGLFSLSLNTASIYDQAGNAGAGLLKSQWQVQVPAVLAIVTGDSQSTSVGNSFNIPLTVRLTDTPETRSRAFSSPSPRRAQALRPSSRAA